MPRLKTPGVAAIDMPERERNRAGTIVTVIVKRSVSPAPNVRAIADCVDPPDCMLDRVGRVRRRVGDSVPQHRAISGHHRPRTADIASGSRRLRIVFVMVDRLQTAGRWD